MKEVTLKQYQKQTFPLQPKGQDGQPIALPILGLLTDLQIAATGADGKTAPNIVGAGLVDNDSKVEIGCLNPGVASVIVTLFTYNAFGAQVKAGTDQLVIHVQPNPMQANLF